MRSFIESKMKMSGPYQAIIISECLKNNGSASLEAIASVLNALDNKGAAYYVSKLKIHPKAVLATHNVAAMINNHFQLTMSYKSEEVTELVNLCDSKLKKFLTK